MIDRLGFLERVLVDPRSIVIILLVVAFLVALRIIQVRNHNVKSFHERLGDKLERLVFETMGADFERIDNLLKAREDLLRQVNQAEKSLAEARRRANQFERAAASFGFKPS